MKVASQFVAAIGDGGGEAGSCQSHARYPRAQSISALALLRLRRSCVFPGRSWNHWLRDLHTDLAYLFFATFLVHFGAALFHGLIRRDGVLESMASWR